MNRKFVSKKVIKATYNLFFILDNFNLLENDDNFF